MKIRSRFKRILHGNYLGAINATQLFEHIVIVTFLIIKLIDQKDNRLAQLFSITEVVLSTYFGTVLSIQQQNSSIGYI